MQTAVDGKGRQWNVIVQQQGSMDCGFACAAMACHYYGGGVTPPNIRQVAQLSSMYQGHGTHGIQDLQNLAHVLNREFQVHTWDATQLDPNPAPFFARVGTLVAPTTPAIVGLTVTDGVANTRHMALAVDFDSNAERMYFLDPYPNVGVVEVWKENGGYVITSMANRWMLDGWVLCTHH